MLALQAEIASDPESLGYAPFRAVPASEGVDPVPADFLRLWGLVSTPSRVGGTRDVPAKDLLKYFDMTARWPTIQRLANTALPLDATAEQIAKVEAALSLRSAIKDYEDFDLTVPAYLNAVIARLDAAIAAGVIGAPDKTVVLGLQHVYLDGSYVLQSRLQELGLASVITSLADLTNALAYVPPEEN
jgi:hypothetical protein